MSISNQQPKNVHFLPQNQQCTCTATKQQNGPSTRQSYWKLITRKERMVCRIAIVLPCTLQEQTLRLSNNPKIAELHQLPATLYFEATLHGFGPQKVQPGPHQLANHCAYLRLRAQGVTLALGPWKSRRDCWEPCLTIFAGSQNAWLWCAQTMFEQITLVSPGSLRDTRSHKFGSFWKEWNWNIMEINIRYTKFLQKKGSQKVMHFVMLWNKPEHKMTKEGHW